LLVLIVGGKMEKPIVNDRNALFAQTETEMHLLKVSPDRDEYMKVWVKEPTWLQVEQALSSVMKVDAKTQSLDLDMNEMYKFMVENFVEKTEPQLSGIELLRLSPYIGAQLKEVLPNPFMDLMGADEGNE
tara:strand:- start:173 stop:562 length:390 start_codon:yes stop_codon:yes gene_type:complete